MKTETTRLNDLVNGLSTEKERLEVIVQSLSRKSEDLDSENAILKSELQRAKQQVNDAAIFLNKELEKVLEIRIKIIIAFHCLIFSVHDCSFFLM